MQHQRGRTDEAARPAPGAITGDALLDKVLDGEGVTVNSAMFKPGARTFWHTHERGQLFFVGSGRGVIATRDGQVQIVQAGDVVHTPAGEEHWHGAAPDCFVSYIAVSLGKTSFLDEVSDEQYASTCGCSAGPAQ
jgi:quercetin dioxygenase-like cupin family protein